MDCMDIIDFVLFVLGLIIGLFASHMRDGLARVITMARYPSHMPGEGPTERDVEWAWTYHRVRRLLGAS